MAFVRVEIISSKYAGNVGVLIESLERHHQIKIPIGEVIIPVGGIKILSISPEDKNHISVRSDEKRLSTFRRANQ